MSLEGRHLTLCFVVVKFGKGNKTAPSILGSFRASRLFPMNYSQYSFGNVFCNSSFPLHWPIEEIPMDGETHASLSDSILSPSCMACLIEVSCSFVLNPFCAQIQKTLQHHLNHPVRIPEMASRPGLLTVCTSEKCRTENRIGFFEKEINLADDPIFENDFQYILMSS